MRVSGKIIYLGIIIILGELFIANAHGKQGNNKLHSGARKSILKYREKNPNGYLNNGPCVCQSSSEFPKLRVLYSEDAGLLGVVNISSSAAVIFDYIESLKLIFGPKFEILLDYNAMMAYEFKDAWAPSPQETFCDAFNNLTSLKSDLELGQTIGIAYNLTNLPPTTQYNMEQVLTNLAETPKNNDIKISKRIIERIRSPLKVLYKGQSSFDVHTDLDTFFRVNLALADWLEYAEDLQSIGPLDPSFIFSANSGLGIFLNFIGQIGERLDLTKLFPKLFSMHDKFLRLIKGVEYAMSYGGVDGLDAAVTDAILFLRGCGSILEVLQSYFNYSPNGVRPDDMRSLGEQARDILEKQIRRYNNTKDLLWIYNIVTKKLNHTLIINNVNITDVVNLLYFRSPREVAESKNRIFAGLFTTQNVPLLIRSTLDFGKDLVSIFLPTTDFSTSLPDILRLPMIILPQIKEGTLNFTNFTFVRQITEKLGIRSERNNELYPGPRNIVLKYRQKNLNGYLNNGHCVCQSNSTLPKLTVIYNGDAQLFGVVNVSSNAGAMLDYKESLKLVMQPKIEVVLDYNAIIAYEFKDAWAPSAQETISGAFKNLTSLKLNLEIGRLNGIASNLTNLTPTTQYKVEQILTNLARTPKTDDVEITKRIIKQLRGPLKVLYKGQGSFDVHTDLDTLLRLNLALADWLEYAEDLESIGPLDPGFIFSANTGLGIFLNFIGQIGEHADLTKLFPKLFNTHDKFLRLIKGVENAMSYNGVDGFDAVLTEVSVFLRGRGSILEVMKSYFNYIPNGIEPDDIRPLGEQARDILENQIRTYNNTGDLFWIYNMVTRKLNHTLITNNVNITDVINLLYFRSPWEVSVAEYRIMVGLFTPQNTPLLVRSILDFVKEVMPIFLPTASNSSASLSDILRLPFMILPGIKEAGLNFNFIKQIADNFRTSQSLSERHNEQLPGTRKSAIKYQSKILHGYVSNGHCICQPNNEYPKITVTYNGDVGSIGLVNVTSNVGALMIYSERLKKLVQSDGVEILFDYNSLAAYQLKKTRTSSQQTISDSFKSLTSLKPDLEEGRRTGIASNFSDPNSPARDAIDQVLTEFAGKPRTENVERTKRLIEQFRGPLRVLYKGQGSFVVNADLDIFIELNLALAEWLAYAEDLESIGPLDPSSILSANSGLGIFLNFIGQIGERSDLIKLFPKLFSTHPELLRIIQRVENAVSYGGVDGLDVVVMKVILFLRGRGSLMAVLDSLLDYFPMAVQPEDMRPLYEQARDILEHQMRTYNDTEELDWIYDLVKGKLEHTLVIRNVNITDVMNLLYFRSIREILESEIRIVAGLFVPQNIPFLVRSTLDFFREAVSMIAPATSNFLASWSDILRLPTMILPRIEEAGLNGTSGDLETILQNINSDLYGEALLNIAGRIAAKFNFIKQITENLGVQICNTVSGKGASPH